MTMWKLSRKTGQPPGGRLIRLVGSRLKRCLPGQGQQPLVAEGNKKGRKNDGQDGLSKSRSC